MYDAEAVRAFFDAYGAKEVSRLERSLSDRVSLELHRRFLARFVRPGDRALDAGAGPGRFTVELARLGARVDACDISPVQLALHREQVKEAGWEDAVLSREVCDIVSLGPYRDGAFDVALAYGGPLSYVFDRRDAALSELLRVVRPKGTVVASVMSFVGATAFGLPGVLAFARSDPEATAHVFATGDLTADLPGTHPCHMFRWQEIQAWLSQFPVRLLAASASGVLALRARPEEQALLDGDEDLLRTFLDWEEEFSREPGALDLGTHILFALERS
jgi:SAM-dependent methyltransferase